MKEKIKKSLVALHEAFVAGLVTLILLGIIGFAVYVVYSNGAAMAEGFGAALAVGRAPKRSFGRAAWSAISRSPASCSAACSWGGCSMTNRIVTALLVAVAFGAGIFVGSGNSALPLPPVVPDVPGVVQAAPDAPLPGHVLVPIAPLPDQKQPKPQIVESPPFGPPPAPEPLAAPSKPEAAKVEPKGHTCPTPCNPQPCRRRWFRR
jgi:hypothetical protein